GRLLPEGAEGAPADPQRLRPCVRGVRRDRGPDLADAGLQDRRADRRPADDVPVGRLYDRRQPGGHPGRQHPVRLHAGGPAERAAAAGGAVRGGEVAAGGPHVRARDRLAHATAGVGIIGVDKSFTKLGGTLADLEVAWQDRLADAEALFAAGRNAGAIADAIYALEIRLKVAICKRLDVEQLPKTLRSTTWIVFFSWRG